MALRPTELPTLLLQGESSRSTGIPPVIAQRDDAAALDVATLNIPAWHDCTAVSTALDLVGTWACRLSL